MNESTTIPGPTLWDLATIVLEEVDRMCADERRARVLAREALIHIIQGHVTNMEVELCTADTLTCESECRPGTGPCPKALRR